MHHAAQRQLKDIHVIFGIGCVLVTVQWLRFFHFEMFPIGSGWIFVSVKINFIFSTIQWCPDYLHDKTDFDIQRHKSFNIMLKRSDSNIDL